MPHGGLAAAAQAHIAGIPGRGWRAIPRATLTFYIVGPTCQGTLTVDTNGRWMEEYRDKKKFAARYTGDGKLFRGIGVKSNFYKGIQVKDSVSHAVPQ